MGFPGVYSELFLLPRPLLHAFSLLAALQKLIFSLFRLLGVADVLGPDIIWPDLIHDTRLPPAKPSVPPAIRVEELTGGEAADPCAVCLSELEAGEEIRRLKDCHHVFHRSCLDRWMDHDQRTCPLCRTPFMPEIRTASERLPAVSDYWREREIGIGLMSYL